MERANRNSRKAHDDRSSVFDEKTNNFINKKVEELGEYLERQAYIYGQNNEKLADITQEYEDVIKQIKSKYKPIKKDLVSEREEYITTKQEYRLEYEEMKNGLRREPGYKVFSEPRREIARLKKEGRDKEAKQKEQEFLEYKKNLPKRIKTLETSINMSINRGEFDEVQSKITKLKKLKNEEALARKDNQLDKKRADIRDCSDIIKELDEKIKLCERDFQKEVDTFEQDKEQALTKVKKQNVFQKFLGSVYNKIGGKKRFNNNVIKPIKDKVNKFKEDVLLKKTYIEMREKYGLKKGYEEEKSTSKRDKAIKTYAEITNSVRTKRVSVLNRMKSSIKDSMDSKRNSMDSKREKIARIKKEDRKYDDPAKKYENGMFGEIRE